MDAQPQGKDNCGMMDTMGQGQLWGDSSPAMGQGMPNCGTYVRKGCRYSKIKQNCCKFGSYQSKWESKTVSM